MCVINISTNHNAAHLSRGGKEPEPMAHERNVSTSGLPLALQNTDVRVKRVLQSHASVCIPPHTPSHSLTTSYRPAHLKIHMILSFVCATQYRCTCSLMQQLVLLRATTPFASASKTFPDCIPTTTYYPSPPTQTTFLLFSQGHSSSCSEWRAL
jgi:hypothetical protein